ncbi:MAG TPA: 3-oxoacyl-[acyl-carrier-protein] reductase [Firmicutes bacterium]|jgi:3-oxoacyl-[acyl-carrier protein] reductase|nr:3-oxoacyl-[acyl-carrier-protein] reductase [Bacillota bacterium]
MGLIPGTAVVTGGSRGIGKAIALKLAQLGAPVAIGYTKNTAKAEDVVAVIRENGGKAVAIQADVSHPEECEKLIKQAEEFHGPIGILVNNAGITRDGLLLRLKNEAWQDVLATNLDGVFYCIQACLRGMIKRRSGRIVNVASIVGLHGNAGQANYAAAKAGVIGLTKSAAQEVAKRGITVNAVAPGFIATDMTAALAEKIQDEYLAKIPVGRFGSPEDVATAVAFFCSAEAGYITGQVLAVDGGLAM